jgi:hypothetical protein
MIVYACHSIWELSLLKVMPQIQMSLHPMTGQLRATKVNLPSLSSRQLKSQVSYSSSCWIRWALCCISISVHLPFSQFNATSCLSITSSLVLVLSRLLDKLPEYKVLLKFVSQETNQRNYWYWIKFSKKNTPFTWFTNCKINSY